jgi:hypothetical protein
MVTPLDGITLQAYFRRLGFPRETQELLAHIRSSTPSRTLSARRGNMPVWYPSKKMHCIIKAESAKVGLFPRIAQRDAHLAEVAPQVHSMILLFSGQR